MKQKIVVGFAMLIATGASVAESVEDVIREGESWLTAQRESQQKVDTLAAETEDTEADYRRLLRQIEGLETYNGQVRKQIRAQEAEIAKTDDSIAKATEVDRQLLPLLIGMVDTYEALVAASVPYLPEERQDRIAFLRETVDRADVSAAEKFRQVLDAYMAELSYGDTIGAYTDTIRTEGGEREVNVLRLGRIGLFYQTADREHTGRWNQEEKRWEPLGTEFRNGIYQAFRVANKLTAPSLLTVPLRPPQPASTTRNSMGDGDEALSLAGGAS